MRGAGIEPTGSCTLSGQPGKQKRTYLLIVRPPELPRLAAHGARMLISVLPFGA